MNDVQTADETRRRGKELTRQLMLAKLAPPGSLPCSDREGRLFEELRDTGWVPVAAASLGVRTGEEQDEVGQRVAVRLIRVLRSGRLHTISRSYITRTVASDVHGERRTRSAAQLSDELCDSLAARIDTSDDEMSDMMPRLVEAWQALSQQHRELLAWRYPGFFPMLDACESGSNGASDASPSVCDKPLTLEEIGNLWGVKIGKVFKVKAEAHDQLLHELRKVGLDDLADRLAKEF